MLKHLSLIASIFYTSQEDIWVYRINRGDNRSYGKAVIQHRLLRGLSH